MENKRVILAKEIEQLYEKSCICTILGKGKTANGVSLWIRSNTGIKDFSYIVEDSYANEGDETVSVFLKKSVPEESFIIFGFSDYDKALQLDKDVFSPNGIRTFFIPFPFSYNETGEYISEEYYSNHYEEFIKTRDMLEKSSRELYDTYIDSQISGDLDILDKYRKSVDLQYFMTECIPTEKTDFIDVGAYTGDTIPGAFHNLLISKYIALEPESENADRIRELIKEKGAENIELIEAGAWNFNTTLSFESAGSSSEVSEYGNKTITVIALDSLIPKLNSENCVFIKMDIEGSEMKALQGAQNLIKGLVPYLAVAVYHRVDDLIKIPQYIENILPGKYQYRLGYYGNNYRELVLYVTPIRAM